MVDLTQLQLALTAAGVQTTVAQVQQYLQQNKIKGGMKALRASGTEFFLGQPRVVDVDHEGVACPLHAGHVLKDPVDPEAQPTDPVIPPNQQGLDVNCFACWVALGNTIDHIRMKGLVP